MAYFTEKQDVSFDAELSGEFFETCTFWTVSDNHEADIGNLLCDSVYRADADIIALFSGESPDRTDDMWSIRDAFYMDGIGFCLGRERIREQGNLGIRDSVARELYEGILARRYDMFAVLVEEVIVLPSELSKYPKIIETDDLQVSFIRYVGMECTDARYLHELTEDDGLPSENELCVIVDDIGLESPDLPDERWSEGESDLEVRIEKCGKSFDGYDLDTRIVKIGNPRIRRDYYAYLVSPIRELASKRNNARNDTIGGRVECIRKIDEAHDIRTSRYNGKCRKNWESPEK